MKVISEKEFFRQYKRIKNETKDEFKELKKKLLKKLNSIILALFLIIAFLQVKYKLYIIPFLLSDNYKHPNENLAYILLGLWLATLYFVMKGPVQNYHKKFKNTVIKPIIENSFPGFKFSAKTDFSLNEFNDSKLFSEKADTINSEDEISGIIGRTSFNLTEVNAEHHQSDRNNRQRTYTVFKGILVKLDFNKHFEGHTVIRNDKAESLLGSWLGKKVQGALSGKFELVNLEDPIFEKRFVCYSTCQQESRYLLTPHFMETLVKIKRRERKKQLAFAFYNNHFLVALPRDKNYFESSYLSKKFAPISDFREIYRLLSDIEILVEDLDLNTRIWTKK